VNCDQRRELLPLYVAGGLEPGDEAELRRHLASGCVTCAANLAEADATFASISLSLDPVIPPPDLKKRVMARVTSAPAVAAAKPRLTAEQEPISIKLFRYFIPTAIAACLAVVITHFVLTRQFEPVRMREQASREMLSAQNLQIQNLAGQLTQHEQVIEALRSKNLKLVELDGKKLQPGATARVVMEPNSAKCALITCGVNQLAAGKTYELWFITVDGKRVPAGTFNVDASGEAMLNTKMPDNVGRVQFAAVTDEPMGGVPQPTGQVQFLGSIE